MWASPAKYIGTVHDDHSLFQYPGCTKIYMNNVNSNYSTRMMTKYYRRGPYMQTTYGAGSYRGWMACSATPHSPLYLNICARNNGNIIDVLSPTYKNIEVRLKISIWYDCEFFMPIAITPSSGNFPSLNTLVEPDNLDNELPEYQDGGLPTP